jgi:hypothetical protein
MQQYGTNVFASAACCYNDATGTVKIHPTLAFLEEKKQGRGGGVKQGIETHSMHSASTTVTIRGGVDRVQCFTSIRFLDKQNIPGKAGDVDQVQGRVAAPRARAVSSAAEQSVQALHLLTNATWVDSWEQMSSPRMQADAHAVVDADAVVKADAQSRMNEMIYADSDVHACVDVQMCMQM